ncbi:MAG TPA: cupin domain-containing protein [Vicinamibacteria bacterium]|nr:cupin domain-containing protein [Vicinamibacteria bacterium]
MPGDARFYRWDEMPKERLTDYLDRRFLHGERTMLAHIYLKKDCFVPQHQHENEQISYILEGALLFKLGQNGEKEQLLKAGDVLVIPSNLPHSALALEDSLSLDVFSPPRQDWIDGTDAYLRQQKGPSEG